jgi:hypothetical protein
VGPGAGWQGSRSRCSCRSCSLLYERFETPPTLHSLITRALVRHCATLIGDGATLQMGIGAIPDAVLGVCACVCMCVCVCVCVCVCE